MSIFVSIVAHLGHELCNEKSVTLTVVVTESKHHLDAVDKVTILKLVDRNPATI